MIAQVDLLTLGNNSKTWIVAIGGLLLTLIVGRFVQAFRNGAGIKDAALAVWLGTNVPKPPLPPEDKPRSESFS